MQNSFYRIWNNYLLKEDKIKIPPQLLNDLNELSAIALYSFYVTLLKSENTTQFHKSSKHSQPTSKRKIRKAFNQAIQKYFPSMKFDYGTRDKFDSVDDHGSLTNTIYLSNYYPNKQFTFEIEFVRYDLENNAVAYWDKNENAMLISFHYLSEPIDTNPTHIKDNLHQTFASIKHETIHMIQLEFGQGYGERYKNINKKTQPEIYELNPEEFYPYIEAFLEKIKAHFNHPSLIKQIKQGYTLQDFNYDIKDFVSVDKSYLSIIKPLYKHKPKLYKKAVKIIYDESYKWFAKFLEDNNLQLQKKNLINKEKINGS